MGLSFHYNGSIAKPGFLPQLMDEVRDIASAFHWKYEEYERAFPKNSFGKPGYNRHIYGIDFTPPGCETIALCFLSNGRMSSYVHLKFYGKTDQQPESPNLYLLSVKTQFAGFETHQLVIQLFRYLSKKYFAGFELTDEGGYWETNDIGLLKSKFKMNAELINRFSSSVEHTPRLPEESIEDYFTRLLKSIRDKNPD